MFFHNEGIGRELLAFAENTAREWEAAELFLWVLEKNDHARLFYEKTDFRPAQKKGWEKEHLNIL